MNKRKLGRFVVGLVALAFLALPLATGCAGGPAKTPAPGAPKKPHVDIYNIIDVTGAYAPIAIPAEKGGKDYLAWVSDQGGLDIDKDGKGDVVVDYHWVDFGNVDARFMSAYKRFRSAKPKPTIIEMWSSPNQEMLKPVLKKDKINCMGLGFSDPQLFPPAWNFMECCSYGEQAAGLIDYYIHHMWGKDPWPKKEHEKLRIAFLTWDTAYGRGPIEPIKKWVEKTGEAEVVAERFCTFLPTDPEIMGFLKEFDKKDVDLIWSNSIVQTPAVITKALDKMGLKDEMVLAANLWAPSDQLIDIVGPDVANKYLAVQPCYIPAAEPEQEGVKFAKMLNDKYRGDPKLPNTMYMRGIRMKGVMLESIRLALNHIMEEEGVDLATACERITGTDVKEYGLMKLQGYSAHHVYPKFNTAPAGKDDRRLTNHERVVGVLNGKVQILSPWFKVPRLVPDEMLEKGYFKDEKEKGLINTHIKIRKE